MAIDYIDGRDGKLKVEKVFGEGAISFLWGPSPIGKALRQLVSRFSLFSALYGFWQKRGWTKRKIAPFIREYGVDKSEFVKKVEEFTSFNDFFIRELTPGSRPLDPSPFLTPADGRYLFYTKANDAPFLQIKGRKYSLTSFLQDRDLAQKYERAPLVIARLCPSDYHRFHFPADCVPTAAKLIEGSLFSVNPKAIKVRPTIFSENKRMITHLKTDFGTILFVEIGATNVGTICQTYQSGRPYKKGDEKGYFSFGGSAVALLFEEGMVDLNPDWVKNTKQGFETYSNWGISLC